MTPENVMAWEVVEPKRGQLDVTEADKLVAFAKARKQKVRGPTLVWHSQLPTWLTSGVEDGSIDKKAVRTILKQHIATEMGYFTGDIWAWDLVNEAFDDDGTLRDSLWLRELGPEYIADSFRWAHKADPKAILFYNDYDTEGINAKSDAVDKLVKELRSEGVPIQGFGVQGHLSTDYGLPAETQANLHRFAELGLKTAVTEADVRITLPASPAEVQAQDNGYSYVLQSCLLERGCISFTVWGFTDKYSWIPGVFAGQGQATSTTRATSRSRRTRPWRATSCRPRASRSTDRSTETEGATMLPSTRTFRSLLVVVAALATTAALAAPAGASPAPATSDAGSGGVRGHHPRACRNGYVGLTFADGPSPTAPDLLKALKREGLRATRSTRTTTPWNVRSSSGRNVGPRCGVGNHTFTHPDLTGLDEAQRFQ